MLFPLYRVTELEMTCLIQHCLYMSQEKKELELVAVRCMPTENREIWKAEINNLFQVLNKTFDDVLEEYNQETTANFASMVQFDNITFTSMRSAIHRTGR